MNSRWKFKANKYFFFRVVVAIIFIVLFIIILDFAIGFLFKKEISRVRWMDDYRVQLRISKNPLVMFEIVPSVGEANSYGCRDYEYSLKKPEGVFRIAVIGDSVAYGLGVKISETFSKQLESRLNEASADRRYEVLNFAVPAYSTTQEAEVLRSKVLKFRPDFLIISAHANDDVVYTSVMDRLLSLNEDRAKYLRNKVVFDPTLSKFEQFVVNTNISYAMRYFFAMVLEKKMSENKAFVKQKNKLELKDAESWNKNVEVLYDPIFVKSDDEEEKNRDFEETISGRICAYYTDPEVIYRLGFLKIAYIIKENNLPSLITYSSSATKNGKLVVQMINDVCKVSDIQFLNMDKKFYLYKAEETFVDEYSHLNQFGHELYANAIFDEISGQVGILQK